MVEAGRKCLLVWLIGLIGIVASVNAFATFRGAAASKPRSLVAGTLRLNHRNNFVTENPTKTDPQKTEEQEGHFVNDPLQALGDIDNEFRLVGSRFVSEVLSIPFVELGLDLLVLLSSLLVALETLQGIDKNLLFLVDSSQNLITYIFAVEFFLRWYSSPEQGPRYFSRPLVLVDLIVVVLPLLIPYLRGFSGSSMGGVIPSWLGSTGGLVNLRLLRVLRLQRVLVDQETFSRFEEGLGLKPRDVRPYQLQLARVVLSLFTLLSVATGLIYTAEHRVNPAIPDYFTALYFGLTTLTTVGFGDITPITTEGKLVVSCSILAGVAVIPAQTAGLVEAFLEYQRYQRQQGTVNSDPSASHRLPFDGMVDARKACSECGASFHWPNASFCWSCGAKLQDSAN